MANIIKGNLKEIRKRRGLQQIDIAEKMGVSVKTISNWETGVRDPSTSNVIRLAEVLDVPPVELIGHIESPVDDSRTYVMQDDSMSPEIMPGDVLTISRSEKPTDGDLVLVEQKDNEGKIMSLIRRLYAYQHMLSLLAVNPSVPPIMGHKTEIKGRVTKLERKI